jgi:PAS domain-containing protein
MVTSGEVAASASRRPTLRTPQGRGPVDSRAAEWPAICFLPGMQLFIEQQNIAYLKRLLATEALSEKSRHLLDEQLLVALRRLAALMAVRGGLKSGAQMVRERAFPRATPKSASEFQRRFEAAPMPLLLIDPGPGLHIVDANRVYGQTAMVEPGKVAGEKLFDVFPDNPGDPFADGVANLLDSLRIVAATGQPHAMAVQRYDVRTPAGTFVERYWQPTNSPVLDEDGNLLFILNRPIDVTARFPHGAPWSQPQPDATLVPA